MVHFFAVLGQKIGATVAIPFVAVWGLVAQPNTVAITPQTEMEVLPAQPDLSSSAAPAADEAKESIGEIEGTLSNIVTPLTKNPIKSPIQITPKGAAKKEGVKKQEPVQPKTEQAAAKPATLPSLTPTARGILDTATFAINTKPDGGLWLAFRTPTGGTALNWGLSGTPVGGTGSIPQFDVSYSCIPSPYVPSSNAADQNPVFDFSTSYKCGVTLTDSQGRAQSKDFSFTTGPGRITVKNSSLNTTLKSDKSTNGFIFDNQSGVPVTITGLVYDASFVSLNLSVPLVLRFMDPITETAYSEQSLQDLPQDPSKSASKAGTGFTSQTALVVKPGTQRLLPVEVLGVQPITFGNVNPEIKVTLRQIITDRPEVKHLLIAPIILWTCIPFDPTKSDQTLPNEGNCK